jgi:hypothetical protein
MAAAGQLNHVGVEMPGQFAQYGKVAASPHEMAGQQDRRRAGRGAPPAGLDDKRSLAAHADVARLDVAVGHAAW